MARRLKKLKIDKIAILTGPNPATEYPLMVLKSDEGTELSELYKATFGEELDISASVSLEQAKECFRIIKSYIPDVPGEIEDVWKLLSQLLVKHIGGDIIKGEIMDEKKEDNNDQWPSVSLPADVELRTIKKTETQEEEEIDEDLGSDPTLEVLEDIREQLAKKTEPEDLWPSIYLVKPAPADETAPAPAPVTLKKADPDAREIPQKKSIDGQGDEDIDFKKEDEEEDLWPTMITPMDMGVVPKG